MTPTVESAEPRVRPFDECATLVRDTVQPSACGDAAYIGLEHIGEGTLSLLNHGCARDVTSVKSRFQTGDILFGKLRPYFRKVIRTRFDGICSTDIWVVRPTEGIDAGYLFYLMASPEFVEAATQGSEGTRMPRAQWEHVSRMEIVLPPLAEQRAIAHILGTLDDKIELNRRMGQTLEEMARALFKSWFIDFDPVRAKMSGRWRPSQSLPGLPAHLYDLFPDRLVPSELGEIPEGWRTGTVGEVTDVVGGTTPSTKEPRYWKNGTHYWATPKDLSALTTPVLLETDRRITDAGLSKIGSGLLPRGTVLLSSRAPVGYLAIAEVPVAINQGFIAMLPRKQVSSLFLFFWSEASHDEILNHANGSTFLEISKSSFRQIPVVVPDTDIIPAFNNCVRLYYKRAVSNARESHTLAEQRDTLFPHLVSRRVLERA